MSDYVPDTWAETWVSLSPKVSFFKAEPLAQLYRCLNTKRNTMDTAQPGFFPKYAVYTSDLYTYLVGVPNSVYYPDGTNQNTLLARKTVVDITQQLYWVFQQAYGSLLVSIEQDDKIWVWVTGTEGDNTETVMTEDMEELNTLGFSYFEKPVHWKHIIEVLREFFDLLDARVKKAGYGWLTGTLTVSTWGYPPKTVPSKEITIQRTGGKDSPSLTVSPFISFDEEDPIFGPLMSDPYYIKPYTLTNPTYFWDYSVAPAVPLHQLGFGWPSVVSEGDYLNTGPYNETYTWSDLQDYFYTNGTQKVLCQLEPFGFMAVNPLHGLFYDGSFSYEYSYNYNLYPDTGAEKKGGGTTTFARPAKKGDTITVAAIGPRTYPDILYWTSDAKGSQYNRSLTGTVEGNVTGYTINGGAFPGTITVSIGAYNPGTNTTPVTITTTMSHTESEGFKVYKLRDPYEYVWRRWIWHSYESGVPIRRALSNTNVLYYIYGIRFNPPEVTDITWMESENDIWDYHNIYNKEWSVTLT